MMNVEQEASRFREQFANLRAEIGKVIVGQQEIVDGVLTTLFTGGHALLEGVPGLGKTLLVRTLAEVLDLRFSRIQFTPDLMPADIIGTTLIDEAPSGARSFRFERGPIFANVLLADEINRATPKTQSALLEAMQEYSVTVGGTVNRLDQPFLVLATQNPLEMEGTYPLPEAQLDRFFYKLLVTYPDRRDLTAILERTTEASVAKAERVMDGPTVLWWREFVREVPIASHVRDYAVRMVLATHPTSEHASEMVRKFVRYGSSPRGAQTLILAGKVRALLAERYNVAFEDIVANVLPGMRHRLILNFEAQAEGIESDQVLKQLIEEVPHEGGEIAA
jgi:MoxR-like ATPase